MMELLLKFGTHRRGVCDNCEEEKIVAKVNEVTQFSSLFPPNSAEHTWCRDCLLKAATEYLARVRRRGILFR